jgi:hypothetical protein
MRKALYFFSQNTVDCYNISLNGFLFYFIGKNVIVFLTKHYQLLQRFFSWVFFLPKLSLLFFFNIKLVENLALYFFFFLLTKKLNHVAKTLYLSSQNTVNYYKLFCSVSKFWITNTTFFSSWNICFIVPLISITDLALIHNYNTIKCICFIN